MCVYPEVQNVVFKICLMFFKWIKYLFVSKVLKLEGMTMVLSSDYVCDVGHKRQTPVQWLLHQAYFPMALEHLFEKQVLVDMNLVLQKIKTALREDLI